MNRRTRLISAGTTLAILLSILVASPAGAITTTRAELRGGELRLEGEDAVANADITADGIVVGSADGGGNFDIRFSPFSSATCVAVVGDGTNSENVSLDRCTPSGGNQDPTANAGPDQTVTDSDNNGSETVTLDGTGSSDPEGPIASYTWTSSGSQIATGANPSVVLAVGSHTITLTVADGDGATASDTMTAVVNAASPPGNLAPTANAGPDQTVTDSDNNGSETVTLDGSGSTDPDGTIVSWEWSENGVPLGGAPAAAPDPTGSATPATGSGPSSDAEAAVAAVAGGTFDHLFESNQADPPGVVPNSFGGSAASAGDVNGDGFDDIIIGSEVWDAGTEFAEGAAIVFLGGANGPVGTNPSNAHALIEMNQAGATVNDVSTAGDVNGDGFDDIIIGSHFYDSTLPGTQLGVDGAAFVFHGGPNGITATGPAQADGAIFSNQLTSGMGDHVDAAGDVNGDGFGDILISVPRQGTLFPPEVPANDRSGNYGAILVFHGGPNGITGTGFGDADAVILPYEDTGQPLPPVDAQVGMAQGAGDINNDGFDDIVVGGTELTVYLGGPNGITAQDIFDATDRIFANPPLGVSQSIGGAGLGFRVDGAGDINGDGFADVIASVPTRQLVPQTVPVQEGAAYIFLGGPIGLGVSSVDEAHTSIFGTISVERLGWTVAGPGDVDGDGFDDVVISAIHYAGSLTAEGVAYLYRGGPQGITATTMAEADSRLEAAQSGATIHENRNGLDAQGAGDVDNDGLADVIVGKAFYDNGELNEGAAFLYRGETFPANPNVAPVPEAGADQTIVDVDADGVITASVDGSASVDPDGSIVSYQWYLATSAVGTGETLLATGPTATFDLPLISPIAAWGHIVTLVVTDDQGSRRGDTVNIFPQLAPDSFEFAEWADLGNWTTTGDVSLGDAGNPFPNPPHVLMRGSSTLSRTFSPTAGTTGLDITFWARGDAFGTNDRVTVQASVDGGPFVDYFTITPADVNGDFVFYGGSAIPISMSWWPATASTVTLRFDSTLSPGADFWLATLTVRSIQAPTGGATNRLPVANAGPDQTVIDGDGNGSEVVTLDGTASTDPDGTIVSWEWRDGPVTIGTSPVINPTLPVGSHTLTLIVTDDNDSSDVDTVIVTVGDPPPPTGGPTLDVDLTVGDHLITLTVTDDQGATATDTVSVSVESPAANQEPTANAGPDQTVTDSDNTGVELVTLDGSGSSDPEGPITGYAWFENGAQIAAGVSPDVPLDVGSHTVTLTVTDGDGLTASDTVVITVDPFDPATNQPPIADAGPDQTIVDSDGDTLEVVTFDGTGSSDPDGTIVAWNWTLNGNPFGNAPTFSLTRPIGTDVVTLTVTDDLGATASDTVVVTVEAAPDPGNTPPTAAAGPDLTVIDTNGDGIETVTLDGSGSSDADGSVDFWTWRNGGTVIATSPTADVPLAVGVHAIELTVTDNGGASATDTVVITVEAGGPPPAREMLLVSSSSGGSVGEVSFADEDVLSFDTATGLWAMVLDGSDVGLGGAGARDVDAVHQLADGSFVLSIVGGSTLPDIGSVDDSDLVRFVPTATGTSTSGTFELYFDGSDVGLSTNGEDIDGVHVLADGDLLLSTSGGYSVDGASGSDEDVIRFSPTTLGSTTAGSFAPYFDGSDIDLNTTSDEDVWGLSAAGTDLHLTTRGSFSTSGLTGTGADVFTCGDHSAGTATSCGALDLFFDGSAGGYGGEAMDAFHLVR